jgi:hypothetical protein
LVDRWTRPALGALVSGLVLLALGFGLAASATDRQVAAPSEVSVAATPPPTAASPASSNSSPISAVLGALSLVIALVLVVVLVGTTGIVASTPRTGSSWLRAPPAAIA